MHCDVNFFKKKVAGMAAPDDAAVLAALRELIQPDNLDELSMNKVMKALHGKFGKGVRARKPWVSEQVALIVNEVVTVAAKKVEPALAAAAPAADEKATLLAEVKQNGFALEYASQALKNDPQIVAEAVKQTGTALRYASVALQNDPQIVVEAVKQNWRALEYASPALKNDPRIVVEAVKQTGTALHYASEALQNDWRIVVEAVMQNGWALQYASPALQNDRQIVVEAVKQNGYALQYASEAPQNDPQIVAEAVKQNGFALKSASVAPELCDCLLRQASAETWCIIPRYCIVMYEFPVAISECISPSSSIFRGFRAPPTT